MWGLSRLFRRADDRGRERPEELWMRLIARAVAGGSSFLDVGCLWRVHGGYAFHAHEQGARPVVGIDVEAATAEFEARNAATGYPVAFHRADVNAPDLPERIGTFDVVFCSGVLYHMPDPVLTLTRLRRLTRQTLILSTASTKALPGQAATFLPFLPAEDRAAVGHRSSRQLGRTGVDTPYRPEKGYGNWFWLPTPDCVRAMVRFAGFRVDEVHAHRYVTTVVATAADAAGDGSGPAAD